MTDLLHDLRIAARGLRRRPRFAAPAVIVLGLGIGLTTAMFGIIETVLLRPLPFHRPDELFVLWETKGVGGGNTRVAPPTLDDWRHGAGRVFSGIAAVSAGSKALTGMGSAINVPVAAVSGEFLSVLGVSPRHGRDFLPEEDRPGAAHVAILGHRLWQTAYGADPAAVGRDVVLDGTAYRVVGIAPRGFSFPEESEVWIPLAPSLGDAAEIRGAHILFAIGRLVNGSPAGAEAALTAVSHGIAEYSGQWGARVQPLKEFMVGDLETPLRVLFGAVALVLLMACANVANLLLARARGRSGELALRTALGAGRGRLVKLLLMESLLLAGAGGLLGLLIAAWGTGGMLTLYPEVIPRIEAFAINGRVLAFAVGAAALAGILAGLVPALRSTGVDLTRALKDSGPGVGGGRPTDRLAGALIVAEVATSLVLLTGAGLLTRTFTAMTSVDPGFRTERVTAMDLSLPAYRYPQSEQWARFYDGLLERVRALPGVESASVARNLPVSGRSMSTPMVLEDAPEGATTGTVQISWVGPEYFETLEIDLREGRVFASTDRVDAPPVAVVNEAFAERFLPGMSAVGRRGHSMFGPPQMREIVGVVENVHHHSLTSDPPPIFYVPYPQQPAPAVTLVVRSAAAHATVVGQVRSLVQEADPDLPLQRVTTMERLVAGTLGEPRFFMAVLALFAGAALLLALTGLYAVVAHWVARRRHELGIRIALGARRVDLLRLVLLRGLGLVSLGVAVGLVGSLLGVRVLQSLVWGVELYDLKTFSAAALLLITVTGVASWIPALRASRSDPRQALRGG
ncbi:MAG: ABC transporter permease [Gemmatimonadetes bacterium]|nr:ABC transporter permease [Gemmatimonadota bacterium]